LQCIRPSIGHDGVEIDDAAALDMRAAGDVEKIVGARRPGDAVSCDLAFEAAELQQRFCPGIEALEFRGS